MEKKKIIIGTFVALILIGAVCAGTVYYYLFAPQFHPKKTVYILSLIHISEPTRP